MKEYDVVLARADVDGNCRVIPREGVESMIEAFREPPKRTICDPERGS